MLDRHRGTFARVARTLVQDDVDAAPPPEPRPQTRAEQRRRRGQEARERRFQHVAALARDGHGVRAVVRETGLARNTVRRWLRAGAAPTWLKGERARITDAFRPYLVRRFEEGEHNATALWREVRARGFRGGVMTVRALVAGLKQAAPTTAPNRIMAPVWRPPSPRQATRLLLADKDVSELDGRFLAALRETIPEIGRAVAEARAFATLVRDRDRAALSAWLDGCRGGPIRGLAEGLRRDRTAVEAALTLPWSTSPVEGQISRLKMLKRAMYGRAKLDLLRARVLAT